MKQIVEPNNKLKKAYVTNFSSMVDSCFFFFLAKHGGFMFITHQLSPQGVNVHREINM